MIIGTLCESHIPADTETLIGHYNTTVNTAYLQQSPMYTISLVTQVLKTSKADIGLLCSNDGYGSGADIADNSQVG